MNPDSADHDIVEQANDLLAEALGHARTYASHDEVRPSAIRGFDKVQEAQQLLTEIDHTRSFDDEDHD